MANRRTQAIVRTSTSIDLGQGTMELELFKADGTPWTGSVTPGASVTNVTVADATDGATAATLANANKAKINELITKLEAAGFLVTV